MLVKANSQDVKAIIEFLKQETARNYFILLTLLKDFSIYEAVWLEKENDQILSGIFLRKSANLQLALSSNSNHVLIENWIIENDFKTLICPKSYCQAFEKHLNLLKVGAEISVLHKSDFISSRNSEKTYSLEIKDLPSVIKLYKEVFEGYPNEAYMAEKLKSNRGIGYYSLGMKSLAQSDMGCIIVGVATSPKDQKKGLARLVLNRLIEELFKEYNEVYLQYEDNRAKALYLSLGFKKIDDVYHYEKRHK